MGLGYPTTCSYQLNSDESYSNNIKIIQYFIMHRLSLCIKLDSFAAYMFYACSFSHNKSVPISIKHKKYFSYLNTSTIVFD